MSQRGAPAAYRGYRLQALYTLKRILASGSNKTLVFHLEGKEDLDIEEDGQLLEAIQVKSYDNLVLSDLSPDKPYSFFRRALDLLRSTNPPQIKLVNFGSIGEEMRLAWEGGGEFKERIADKLRDYGYIKEDIQSLFENIELIELADEYAEAEVYDQLQRLLTGIDPFNAFDLLHYWLYIQSEKRSIVTYSDLIAKVQNVGKFLSERFHHHQEWFTSIQAVEDLPIDDKEKLSLRAEFYRGVSARHEHILAGLDFRREQKMAEIAEGFSRENVVIVHAASGQGKTTLAYRYLHEAYPSQWRFSIQLVENRQHALRIATALAGHANAVQAPMVVFIDVSPRDADWPELVKQLANHPYLQILVAIREEDFRRANISNAFEYVPVDLSFSIGEASLIYERARDGGQTLKQLTFQDAWHSFGGDGPLLEFVYFLTQTETLRQRLQGQVDRIRNEVREKNLSPDELHLLRLVSVATAYDTHVHIPDLLTAINVPEPSLTLELFEKEYLLRVIPGRHHISCLHPVRSKILCQLLTDPTIYPWSEMAKQVLPMVPQEEWETFILRAFLDHPESYQQIVELVKDLRPNSWTGTAAIIRSLLWAGLKEYVEENWDQVEAAQKLFGRAWYFILDLSFAGEEAPSLEGWWKSLGTLITQENQTEIERIRQSQTPKENVFQHAHAWLNTTNHRPSAPKTTRDWKMVPEVLYWSFRWGLSDRINSWITDESLSYAIERLPLFDFSELSLGLYLTNRARHSKWLEANRVGIEERLAKEYDVVALVEKENSIFLHFLTYPEEPQEGSAKAKGIAKSIHDRTVERLQLIRQLFPYYEKYGSQGYGHQITGLGFDHDDTTKTGVGKEHLPPNWPVQINGIAIGLVQYRFRPDQWDEYLSKIIETRQCLSDCFSKLPDGLARYFRQEKPFNLLKLDVFRRGEWEKCERLVSNVPLLPKAAVDPWGMAQPEGKMLVKALNLERMLPISVLDQMYKPYLDVEHKYFSSMSDFMRQCLHVAATSFGTGKLPENSPQRQLALERLTKAGVKTNFNYISTTTLSEGAASLIDYQAHFRRLFGHRVNAERLAELEKKEFQVVNEVLPLWYFFAFRPRTATAVPLRQIPVLVHSEAQRVLRNIDEGLRKIQREDATASRIQTDLKWNGLPTIWVSLDITDPTLIYAIVEKLIEAVRDSVGPVTPTDLEHFLIEERFQFIVIVPTVRGKMINSFIWPLKTIFTIASNAPIEEKLWAYIPQELPQSFMTELDISLWEANEITLANQFSAAASGLSLLLSMISRIRDMPEPKGPGLIRLETFMEARSKELSKLLQMMIDSEAKLLDIFNSLTEDDQRRRSYLAEAVKLFSGICKELLPTDNFDRQEGLDMNAVFHYAERLQTTIQSVETIKLLWIADALGCR